MTSSPDHCEYCGSRFIAEDKDTYFPQQTKTQYDCNCNETAKAEFIVPPLIKTEIEAPPFDTIFKLNVTPKIKNRGDAKYGGLALALALIGFLASPFESPSPVLFIVSLFLVKKQNSICRIPVSGAAKILSFIGLAVWVVANIILRNRTFA